MRLSDFDFDLPPELIAQSPPAERSHSRLLCVGSEPAPFRECRFDALAERLRPPQEAGSAADRQLSTAMADLQEARSVLLELGRAAQDLTHHPRAGIGIDENGDGIAHPAIVRRFAPHVLPRRR